METRLSLDADRTQAYVRRAEASEVAPPPSLQ